jgi:predicted nucleic-acid-binding protein
VLPVFFLITGVASLVLVVMVVALVRHVRVLAGSLRQFQEEVEPVVETIRSDTERARDRLEAAGRAAEALREPSERGPRA